MLVGKVTEQRDKHFMELVDIHQHCLEVTLTILNRPTSNIQMM